MQNLPLFLVSLRSFLSSKSFLFLGFDEERETWPADNGFDIFLIFLPLFCPKFVDVFCVLSEVSFDVHS